MADERASGLFERRILRSMFGLCSITDSGEEDGNLNYVNYMMSQIWINI
jgi:hypothetical protein